MTTATPIAPTRRAAPLATSPADPATQVVTFGNLVWMVWVWVLSALAAFTAIYLVKRYGDVDQSMFDSVMAGWQRWIVLAAGVITAATLLPMLVTNGVTRSRVGAAATTSMVVIAGLVTTILVIGYSLESFWYDHGGWPQVVSGGAELDGAADIATLAVRSFVTFLAYFASGWIIGLGFYRWGKEGGIPLVPFALVPAALCELLLTAGFGAFDFRLFDEDTISLPIGVAGSLVVTAAAVAVARSVTRTTPIRV